MTSFNDGVLHSSEEVWLSRKPYHSRSQKVAMTLAAIVRLLEKRKLAGDAEDEFLRLYECARGLSDHAYTKLCGAPEAFSWVFHAYHLLLAYFQDQKDGNPADGAAVSKHLEEFKPLILGARFENRAPLSFETPYIATLPFHIPCTDLLILGEGSIGIRSVDERRISITAGSTAMELTLDNDASSPGQPVHLVREPTLQFETGEIALSPYAFRPSKIASHDREHSLDLGYEGHQNYLPDMEQAFEILKRFSPEIFDEIVDEVALIGLSDPEVSDTSQSSFSDMPGTFIIPCFANPYVTVECVIHEYFHNRLFALEDLDRVFVNNEDEQGDGEVEAFSPWRATPRPIRGLLHATFVFIPVAEFWLSVYRNTEQSDPINAYALDDSVRQSLYLRIGMHMLAKHGEFTEHGKMIFDAMNNRVQKYLDQCKAVDLPDDTVSMLSRPDGSTGPLCHADTKQLITVRDNLRASILKNDIHGDCRELPFEI